MTLREQAIAEYHELLHADAGLSRVIFEKLRAAMRRDLLVYGDRPIGVGAAPAFAGAKAIPATVEENRISRRRAGESRRRRRANLQRSWTSWD